MWNQILAMVAKVLAPREAALYPTGTGGNITLAVTTTSDRIEIPSWLRGRYVAMTALTANAFVQFGDSAVDVDATKANTLSTETVTLADDVGFPIASGTTQSFVVPKYATHMAWEGDASGTLHILPSSQVILRGNQPKP